MISSSEGGGCKFGVYGWVSFTLDALFGRNDSTALGFCMYGIEMESMILTPDFFFFSFSVSLSVCVHVRAPVFSVSLLGAAMTRLEPDSIVNIGQNTHLEYPK